jgi:ParB family chromosome partitioning protein
MTNKKAGTKASEATSKTPPKKTGPACPQSIGDVFTIKVGEALVDKGANPRKTFDRENLNSMSATIKQVGIINPLSVFWGVDGKYHLIAGERRLKAAKLAGLKVVPVKLFASDDVTVATIRLTENLHHDALNPLEEALALKPLIGKTTTLPGDKKAVTITNKVLAKLIKKSQAWVSQRFSLLDMPQQIQDALLKGKISFVHARDLIALPSQEAQVKLFEKIMKGEAGRDDIKDAAAKAKTARARKKGGKTRGRTADDGEVPNITRQSLDTALERLQSVPMTVRKKTDVREGIATGYERFDRAKSDDKKSYYKGFVAALEWAGGLREKI